MPRYHEPGTSLGRPIQQPPPQVGAPITTPTIEPSKWPDCLAEGYFEKGALRPGYVVRERMEDLAQEMANARPGLTTHQIRRFFQHCRAIEARLRSKSSTWERERIEFMKIDISVADAYGKNPPKVPELFRDFVRKNVAAVKNEKDFLEGFLPHFEALVGFGSAYFRNERN